MTPIATIYQQPDGNFGIMSSLATHLKLAQILAALTVNLLEQVANPPVTIASQSPVAEESVAPAPLVIDHDVIVEGAESIEIKAENGAS